MRPLDFNEAPKPLPICLHSLIAAKAPFQALTDVEES